MVSRRLVGCAVALAAALTGCSDDGAPGGAAPSPTGSAATTSLPSPSAAPTLAPSPTPAAPLSASALTQALLPPTALGDGFTVDRSPGANDTSDVYRDCPRLLSSTRPALDAAARRDYRRGDEGPFLTEQLASAPAGEVRAALEALRAAVADCPELTLSQEEGGDVTLTVRSRPASGLPGAAVAFSVTATNADFGLDVAASASGRALVLVTQVAYGGADPALTDRVLRRGVEALPAS